MLQYLFSANECRAESLCQEEHLCFGLLWKKFQAAGFHLFIWLVSVADKGVKSFTWQVNFNYTNKNWINNKLQYFALPICILCLHCVNMSNFSQIWLCLNLFFVVLHWKFQLWYSCDLHRSIYFIIWTTPELSLDYVFKTIKKICSDTSRK